MRCYQLARTVACDDIKHLRVPFLCSDDLWRFVSALDASVHFWRGKWTFGLGVLTIIAIRCYGNHVAQTSRKVGGTQGAKWEEPSLNLRLGVLVGLIDSSVLS